MYRPANVAVLGGARGSANFHRRGVWSDLVIHDAIILVRGTMPQVSTQEFEQLPLRVHTFLAGVPLHDVWSVDLPRWRAGVTLDEFLRTTNHCKVDTCCCSKSSSLFTPSPRVRMLLNIRLFVG